MMGSKKETFSVFWYCGSLHWNLHTYQPIDRIVHANPTLWLRGIKVHSTKKSESAKYNFELCLMQLHILLLKQLFVYAIFVGLAHRLPSSNSFWVCSITLQIHSTEKNTSLYNVNNSYIPEYVYNFILTWNCIHEYALEKLASRAIKIIADLCEMCPTQNIRGIYTNNEIFVASCGATTIGFF
jgi:hypothetical protein